MRFKLICLLYDGRYYLNGDSCSEGLEIVLNEVSWLMYIADKQRYIKLIRGGELGGTITNSFGLCLLIALMVLQAVCFRYLSQIQNVSKGETFKPFLIYPKFRKSFFPTFCINDPLCSFF